MVYGCGVKETMPRPCRRRIVRAFPCVKIFKPAGTRCHESSPSIQLRLDEFEALRLADYEGLQHEEAALKMGISRPTFTRLIEAARHKVASALVDGAILVMEGGEIEMAENQDKRTFVCDACGHRWQIPYGTGCPTECPQCASKQVHRDPAECGQHHGQHRGHGQGHGTGRGRCCRRKAAKES